MRTIKTVEDLTPEETTAVIERMGGIEKLLQGDAGLGLFEATVAVVDDDSMVACDDARKFYADLLHRYAQINAEQ